MIRDFKAISKAYLNECKTRLSELQLEAALLETHIKDISKVGLSTEFPHTYPNGVPAAEKKAKAKVAKVAKKLPLGAKPKRRKYTKRSNFWEKQKQEA